MIGVADATSRSFATNKKIRKLVVKYDGMEVSVEGYESDQVSAVEAGAKAALDGVKLGTGIP